MRQYGFILIYDAYYAATALSQVPNLTIITTDTVHDRVLGIERVDPREI